MGESYVAGIDMPTDNRLDFRSSFGNDAKGDCGGDLAQHNGVDLNAGADMSGNGTIRTEHDNPGEDLNDSGMDAVIDNFQADKWSDLSLDGKKQSMSDLANYVANDTGLENPPEIIFRDDMPDGSYGGYNPETNIMEINQNMLDDSEEAADTIAHEMWHAYQQQCAADPSSEKGREYQEGFENYISPEYDYEGYQNQMVEAEAREYAQGFKDKLTAMKGAS